MTLNKNLACVSFATDRSVALSKRHTYVLTRSETHYSNQPAMFSADT